MQQKDAGSPAVTWTSKLPTYTVASWLRSCACWPIRLAPTPAVMRPPATPAVAMVEGPVPQKKKVDATLNGLQAHEMTSCQAKFNRFVPTWNGEDSR